MPTPPKALRRRPADLALFTGRKTERGRLEQLFTTLLGQSANQAPLITQFYGLGGIGKSFLRLWAEQYWKKLQPDEHKRLRLAAINLDVAQVWTLNTPVPDFWWQVRMAVNRAGISTIFFDDLYFTLWKRLHPGHAKPEHKGFFGELLEGCSKVAEGGEVAAHADPALDALQEQFKELQGSFKSLKLVSSLANYLRDRHRQRRVKETVGFDPGSLDDAEQVSRLPEFIARDVQAYLNAHEDHAFALLVDGFERVQSVNRGDDIQHSFERFCGCLAFGGEEAKRIAVIVFGRDRLKWDILYSDPDWPRHWSLHPLTGWPEPDARAFLLTAEAEYDQLGDAGTATRIRQYTPAILQAAYSEKDGPVIGSWHPFHLALAVDMAADHGPGFIEEMLGHTPDELLERFTRYLDTERRRAYHLFALAVDFDEPLFRFFVEQNLLTGYGVTQFVEAAAPWTSYVTESRTTPGRYRFHRLMQEMLLRSLRENDAYLAAARRDLAALLDHFFTASRFVNEAVLDALKLTAYARGLEILLYHAEDSLENPPRTSDHRSLLTPEQTCQCFALFQNGFMAGSQAAFRQPFHQRLVQYVETALGKKHPLVAYALSELSLCLAALAAYADAEQMMRRALSIDEQNFGTDHPLIAVRLNNLASLLKGTDPIRHLTEAEALMRRSLTIDMQSTEPDPVRIAIGLNNLASLLKDTNRLIDAEPLIRQALAIVEDNYEADHPYVAIPLSNLAGLLMETNRLAEAEPLSRRVVAILEKTSGVKDPKVATALNNLAHLLRVTNRLKEAEPLMRRALAIDEQVFGPDHPSVAIRLSNLASLLRDTNRLAEAESLIRRALTIDEQTHGPDHPNVSIRLNILAVLLQETNRLAEAESLMRRHLEIFLRFTKATGHPHPNLLDATNNYIDQLSQMDFTAQQIDAKMEEVARECGFSVRPQQNS